MNEDLEHEKLIQADLSPEHSADSLAAILLPERYSKIELIARGGMGCVLKAWDSILQRELAIKLILQGRTNDEKSQSRFLRETKILASLDHENIVKVLSSGFTRDGIPFCVMEFLRGHTLADELKSKGKLEADQFFQIITDVISGLVYASEMKVVHRDLKPSNIFIEYDYDSPLSESADSPGPGQRMSAKIIDFGVAMQAHDAAAGSKAATITGTGTILGSPLYMSPEQCRGESASYLSDIYSLACIIYECLAGEPPFKGNNAFETMYMHMSASPPSLEKQLDSEIGRQLAGLITKCLQKTPADRPQSMLEIQDLIRSFRSKCKDGDLKGKGRKTTGKPKRNLRKTVLLAILFFTVTGSLIKNLNLSYFRATEKETREEKKHRELQRQEEALERLKRSISSQKRLFESEKARISPQEADSKMDSLLRYQYGPLLNVLRKRKDFTSLCTFASDALEFMQKHKQPQDNDLWEILFLAQRAQAYSGLANTQAAESDLVQMQHLIGKPVNKSYKFYWHLSRFKFFAAGNQLGSAWQEFLQLAPSWINVGLIHQIGNETIFDDLPGDNKELYTQTEKIIQSCNAASEQDKKYKQEILTYSRARQK